MENYFILLELPFDLPESDTNKISEAISKKQAQWSRDQSNPVKKAKASEYLAALEDIKKVMLDPTARKQEAAKAKQIKASKAKELEAKLSLYRAKGDELSEKDLKRLVKVFGAFGFTADEIKKKFGSGNKKQDKIDPSEVLDKTQARNVQNFMQQLDMKEKTLYDFLSLAPTASWNQLCEAADSMKKKILAKGDKTGRDNAVQSLCGLCVVIFKDVASKKKYDNYVNLTKYRAVNEAVDELALSNQKRIEPKMKESLIDIAVRQYHVSVSDASVYINHYCEYMGYALPENKIVCGLCGTENPAGTTNCVKCGKPLIIPCPACSAENNNSAKVCAKCGFDLTKMDKAVELLRQAKQKYSEKALEEAERLVKEAKAYWPNHADVLSLEKTIQDERKQAADTIAAIMKDIQDKKMYAAQTKIDQAKANGFSIDPSVASKVTAVLKEVESQLAIMRNASGDEAFTIAMKLTELIADSDELNQSLLQSYTFNGGMSNGQPISKVLQALLKNITKINGCEKQMIEILLATSDNQALFENILSVFMTALREPSQLEQLCVKYVEVTESLTDRQLNRFEQLLLETPGAAPIATRLCARKIASAKNPENEFWRFYDNQRSRILANSGFAIEPMILACINNVDAKIREDVAIDILRKINASVINDGETIMVLTNAVNDCSVKELSKMDSAFLQRVCQIRAKVDKSGLEKIKAVFIGEMLTANNAQRKRPVNLSGELAQTGISLKSVEKSDYEAYIKNYFDEYFVLLQASEDVPALMRIFYHGRYFSNFIDDYISVLKKKAKKETERWKRILGWTCVYLVTAERSDQAAEELYKPIVRYLRSLDEDGLLDVRQAVIKDIPSSRCDYLFDEVRRKEGLAEKLGGFFHKK